MGVRISEEEWNYWFDRVYAYFYRRVGNREDVEDLSYSTLEDFFLKDKKIDNPQAFLWGIARNKMREYIRSKKRNPVSIDDKDSLNEPKYTKPEEISEYYLEKIDTLKDCIKKELKETDQKIIELNILHDFSSKEVAEKLGTTPENVRQRLSRSLKKLRQKCKEIWYY
jgi:RNA polymerase sigma factor (sigma-70 family)